MADAFLKIADLGCSQIYLSEKKLCAVRGWFTPTLENFVPVPVRDFLGNGQMVLTDGHTRTFVAWENGLTEIPVVYDEDEMVTNEIGHALYVQDIIWCVRFGITSVVDLSDRILPEEAYERLWLGRCDRLNHLVAALHDGRIDRAELANKQDALAKRGWFVYGISADLTKLCCEDPAGHLTEFLY